MRMYIHRIHFTRGYTNDVMENGDTYVQHYRFRLVNIEQGSEKIKKTEAHKNNIS